MKIPIMKTIVGEYIDIEFPYFYVHDLSDESQEYVIYGKIMEDKIFKIRETVRYDNFCTTYEIVHSLRPTVESLTRYLTDPVYKSSKSDFDAVYTRMMLFVKSRMS